MSSQQLWVSIAITAFQLFAWFVVAVYVLSGLEDILFDLYFWGHRLRRWLFGRRFPRVTLEWLEAREQQPIAILVPAWRESGVIGRMLRNACETIRYRNYEIFVGTYPNDPETQSEVDLVARQYPRVHKVVGPVDGPTTKAHNLNTIYGALREYEAETGRRFEIIVTHDAEDIIHPLSLLLYNYLIPRKDMIQLPVFPVPVPLWNVTYWTYADEFAERHTQELRVREASGGFIPSAGVGTAYTRRAFELVGLLSNQEIFSTRSLTEDYLFGLRLRLEGLRCAFVTQRIVLPVAGRAGRRRDERSWVATYALFPRELSRAIRQKSRWILGIALQSWASTGWPGGLIVRWNLLHDRKVILTSVVSFLGYVMLASFVLYETVAPWIFPDLPPLIPPESAFWVMTYVATGLMVWRLIHRVVSVKRVYGVWPALTAIPRVPWCNFINFVAVLRAVVLFAQNRRRGLMVAWDKTEHEFPTMEVLAAPADLRGAGTAEAPAIVSDTVVLEDEATALVLEQGLRSPDEKVRCETIRRIPRALGRRLLPQVLECLRDESWRVRAEACRSLGFFRLPEAATGLERAATDSSWIVRANAAKALTKLGDAGEAALLNLVRGQDRYAREVALATLEQAGFVGRNLLLLQSPDPASRRKAEVFFDTLERFGPSRLAREMRDRASVCGGANGHVKE